MNDNIKNYFKEIPNYLSFFVFSSFMISLSPILIEIGKTFSIDPRDLSLIFASITVGGIAGRLTSFFYRARFNNLHIIITAYSLLSILVIILSQIRTLALFFIIYFLSGYLLGIILVIAMEDLLESPITNKGMLINIATSFFPLGSIVFPPLVSILVKNGYDWKYLYYALFSMTVLMIILYSTLKRYRKHPSPVKEQRLILKGIFTDRRNNIIFIIMFFCLMLYVVPEFVLSNWSPTFYRMESIIGVQSASYMLSIFWTAIIIGRILFSFITGRIKSRYIMLILVLISLVSTVLLIFSKSSQSIYLLIGLAGLGYSALYPLILSAGSTVYKKGRGTMATLMLLSSGIGVSLASYLTRTISKYNMFLSMFMAVIFITMLLVLIIILIFYMKINKKADT